MISSLLFFFLAALVLIPALLVVTVRNVFHSALWLIVSLMGVAGVYACLAADFLFAVQILVYVGGVMVLLLFVVLLSGKPSDWAGRQVSQHSWLAALAASFVAAAIVSVIAAWPLTTAAPEAPLLTTGALGSVLMNELVLPFEVISLVLLASLVGAVYFSAKKKPS